MNRRSFFKTIALSAASIPFLGMGVKAKTLQLELDDLYSYAEFKDVIHPIHGRIPYKLFPYQRDILKAIHENQNLIIVKGRQIGMTTMLAVYAAWLSHRRPVWNSYIGVNRYTKQDFKNRMSLFHPAKLSKAQDAFQLCFYDESHYGCKSFEIVKYPNRKNVMCGTPDGNGVLKRFITHKQQADWAVLYYPISKCVGSWDVERMNRVKPYFSQGEWAREFECQFI